MLRELLICAARPGARFFTIGCDLGGHIEEKMRTPVVSGGYVQFALQDYADSTPEQYMEEARRLEAEVRAASRGHYWRAVMQLQLGNIFRLGMDPETEAPTLSVHFWARGADLAQALMSREAVLAALKTAMFPTPSE